MSELFRLALIVGEVVRATPALAKDETLGVELNNLIVALKNRGVGWSDERRAELGERMRASWEERRRLEIFRVESRDAHVKYVQGIADLTKVINKRESTIRQYLSKGGGTFSARAPSVDVNTPYALCKITRLSREEAKDFLAAIEREKVSEKQAGGPKRPVAPKRRKKSS